MYFNLIIHLTLYNIKHNLSVYRMNEYMCTGQKDYINL